MIYQVKQGTKSYEFIKDVLDREYIEYKSYMKRVDEAVGFKVEKYKACTPNESLARDYRITEILIPMETYNKLDKKIWNELGIIYEDTGYQCVKPNKRTKQGKLISKAMESYISVATQLQIMKQLNLDFPDTKSFHLTQLFRNGDDVFVYADDRIDAEKDNPDLKEITKSEFEKIIKDKE